MQKSLKRRAGITSRNCKNKLLGEKKINISTSKALLIIGMTHTRPSNLEINLQDNTEV